MQELEKILEEIERIGNIKFASYTKPLITVEDVIKIIRKHMNDGWIPVEERLPAEGEEVLITTDVGLIATGYIHCCEWITGVEPDYPIAWRPLPEPYIPRNQNKPEDHYPDWRTKLLNKFDRRE